MIGKKLSRAIPKCTLVKLNRGPFTAEKPSGICILFHAPFSFVSPCIQIMIDFIVFIYSLTSHRFMHCTSNNLTSDSMVA